MKKNTFKEGIIETRTKTDVLKEAITPPIAKRKIGTVNKT